MENSLRKLARYFDLLKAVILRPIHLGLKWEVRV